jgi:hypothetical protein
MSETIYSTEGDRDRLSSLVTNDADGERLARVITDARQWAEHAAGTEWFWRIVDADGLGDVPSDEEPALRLLCRRAAKAQELQAENARLRAIAQSRYELLRECQSEFKALGSKGLVETIEAALARPAEDRA